MSLQTILSICESVGINDQRFVGQTLSRNQKITTSEILTVVPFAFDMRPMNYLLYSQNRGTLNQLRLADKSLTQYLNFGSTGWLNYIKYQGDMTSGQIAACQWQTSSANKTLVLGSLPSISSTAYLFRVGDFVQVGLYSYIVTADVLRGTNSTVNVPVHRNLHGRLCGWRIRHHRKHGRHDVHRHHVSGGAARISDLYAGANDERFVHFLERHI
jgi:hypothetical protein